MSRVCIVGMGWLGLQLAQKLKKEGILNNLVVTDLVVHSDDFMKRNPYIKVADTKSDPQLVYKANLIILYFLFFSHDFLKSCVLSLHMR